MTTLPPARSDGRGKTSSVVFIVKARLYDSWLVVVLLLAWQWVTMAAGSLFFPTPLTSLQAVHEMWLSAPASSGFLTDAVYRDIIPSLGRMLSGWALAAVIGVGLGLMIGRLRSFSDYVDPSLQFLRAIPGPALIPIFLILLGTGLSMRVSLIAFGSVWPILLNTIEGVRTVNPGYLQTATVYRMPRHARTLYVIIPAAMPKIIAGLKVSIAIALILMVISEMVAASSGIGFMVFDAQTSFMYDRMWAGICLLAILGFVFNVLFDIVEARLLAWHRGVTSGNVKDA